MATSILLSAALAVQPLTSVPGPEIVMMEQKDVAFEALSSGNVVQALADLEARLPQDPSDPALLINLGTAYAKSGKTERAAAAYRAAADSQTRYRLELASGRWMDSRSAARRALASLERVGMFAAR